jgi:methanethiol S-methyltransferase
MKRSTALADYGMMAAATVLGGGSLVLFAFGGMITFARTRWPEPTMLLWDAGLSFAFFFQHSGMVRRQFRARLSRVLPDRYQGTIYSVASGTVLAVVALFWQRTETHLLVLKGIPYWIALACSLFAFGVLVWGGLALRAFDLLGLAPVKAHLSGKPFQPTPFVVRGPYRWVRHPLYAGVLALLWATPDVTTDRLLLNVLWTAWIVVATRLEERDLAAAFGGTYREYQQTVPMLIPWRRPSARPKS